MVRFGTEDCSALLDTGADWSLIDDSLLNEEERTEFEHSGDHGLYGRGVSGESITILGEVWRTLTVGELCTTVRGGAWSVIPRDSECRLLGTGIAIAN